MTAFEFELPAVRGVQAGQPYYLTACPLGLLARLFPDSADSPSDQLVPTALNRSRIPEIVRYVTDNPRSYVFGAMAASVDRPVAFEPSGDGEGLVSCGRLRVPLAARLALHDGQHRCAGLQEAVRANPKLANETIGIVLFVDPGLRRGEQIFTDLKRHERRLPRSLSILHDERDEFAGIARQVVRKVRVFGDSVEMARTTISNRSRKLFTLSAIYQATKTLLSGVGEMSSRAKPQTAVEFWDQVAEQIPDWRAAVAGEVNPSDLRKGYVHAHGIALAALGRVGHGLLVEHPEEWQAKLRGLSTLDWSRSNSRLWEGRAMIAGRLSKANSCVVLTGNAIKQHLRLPLTPDEQKLESQFKKRGRP